MTEILAPIKLDFYNDEDVVVKTFERRRIPTYLFDTAIDLQKALQKNENTQEVTNALYDFIVEFFGNKFTREELKKNTDLIECISVLGAIPARANQMAKQFAIQNAANPTLPSPKKK